MDLRVSVVELTYERLTTEAPRSTETQSLFVPTNSFAGLMSLLVLCLALKKFCPALEAGALVLAFINEGQRTMKRNMYGAMNLNYKSLILAISLLFALSASISAAPGDLDPTFGNGGKRTDWAGYASEVAIQPDGKIVVVGDACCSLAGVDFRVARYNPDGSPDTTFGGGTGRVTTDFNGENDASSSVVL